MQKISIPRKLLPTDGRFGCGPAKIRGEQLNFLNQLQPHILGTSHRQAPVKNLVASVQNQLLELFAAPAGYTILLANGGATTFWDSATHSLIKERSQHAAFGEFGAKFASCAARAPFLAEPQIITAPAGDVALCHRAPNIDVYAYPHNETSTGAQSPVRRIAPATQALTVVDGTSAAGGIMFDAAATDIYYFSAQKNFASDGGIWFALASPAALERIAELTSGKRYIPDVLNLAHAVSNSQQNQTLNTPALTTLALLDAQLRWILSNGGMEWAHARTRESSDMLYAWAEAQPYAAPFVSAPEHRSQVVVTIDFAPEINAAELAGALRANGILDTEPYRKLGRNQLRIATFTAIEPQDVAQLIKCLDYTIANLG